ncbi:MAG: thioredoxin family protein [Bacteroidota bacterium]|nr:thioredoxin family protein [Bacteroidota bacterium]
MTSEQDLIVVKYHEKSCARCEEMLPAYTRLSFSKRYQNITFILIDAMENPVAKQLVGSNKMPFIGIYNKGMLLKAASVDSEDDLRQVLDILLNASLIQKTPTN